MAEKIQLGALEIGSNEYVTPTNASKDKQYKCVDCDRRVILRKGTIRKAHFAHHSQTNVCSYYDHPNEAQIHKDAKLLMAKMLTQKKLLEVTWDCAECGAEPYAFQDTSCVTYKDGDVAVLEHRDKNNKWVADVALVNNGEVRYIFEIKNTHATLTTVRPEPWFEVDAKKFIESINNIDSDPDLAEFRDTPDFTYGIECVRQNIKRYCYGSFCYKEPWVRRIPGYDTSNSDNSCILCKKVEYSPQSDGCTGKFQKGEIRVCDECMWTDIHEKKIRRLYSNDKPVVNNVSNYPNLKTVSKAKTTAPQDDTYILTNEDRNLLKNIPVLAVKKGVEQMWKQDTPCVECKRIHYSPLYDNRAYYSICKICISNDESKKSIKSNIETGKVSYQPKCLIMDD
jgi:hypothetical protein